MKGKRKYNFSTLARLLFALVMLFGIAVGNVYAKYISQEESDPESARVAAWGIEINITDNILFGKRYVYDDVSSSSIVENSTIDGTEVILANDSLSYLIAPGATGSMSFTISGQAEVASKVSFDVTGVKDVVLKGVLKDASSNTINVEYLPLIWTISDGTSTTTGSLKDCMDVLGATTLNVNPNVELDLEYTLSWKWNYENDSSKLTSGSPTINIDQADTLLSLLTYDKKNDTNKAASYISGYTFEKSNDTSLNASLVFKIIVEQVD